MATDSVEGKEKRVMKLLEEGWTFKEIAQKEHVSFSFISMVNKKRLGIDRTENKKLSIPTQALKSFSEGNDVLQTTIALDRPLDEIQGYFEDYLETKKLSDLVLLVECRQHQLPIIKKIIRFILSNPISQNDMIIALALATDISRLRNIKKKLEENIKVLKQKSQYYK